jgi:hypothetical protein
METMTGAHRPLEVSRAEDRRAWARTGTIAAYAAAVGFFLTTALYLLDVYDVLDPSPQYVATSAGQLTDEARFWSAMFMHQHAILWDVVARDLLGPAAFVALIVVGLALRCLVSRDRPDGQLMVVFLAVGGAISAIASLLYLGNVEFWRLPWGPIPHGGETSIIAVGRATTAIDNLTTWPEAFGYLVIALGIACLGSAIRRDPFARRRLSTLAFVTAAASVALAVATMMDADTARAIMALAVGVVLAPTLCVALGRLLRAPARGRGAS